jgi:hypothetical protein
MTDSNAVAPANPGLQEMPHTSTKVQLGAMGAASEVTQGSAFQEASQLETDVHNRHVWTTAQR